MNRPIDIVSCSLDFLYSLFDQSDSFCSIIRNLTENGTIWINAVGDEARGHWYGVFRDENDNDLNDFGPGEEALQVFLNRSDYLEVRLSWNDSWSRSGRDYDLYVFAPDGSYIISKNPQNGYDDQRPIEAVALFAPVRGNYSIKIKKYNASPDNAAFQLFSSQDLLYNNMENSSLGALASCHRGLDYRSRGCINPKTGELQLHGPELWKAGSSLIWWPRIQRHNLILSAGKI